MTPQATFPQLHVRIFRCLLLALALAAPLLFAPTPLPAQQFGTDDAMIAEFGACQVEAWQGETERRIEPACHLLRNLEITLGIGMEPDRNRVDEYTVEAKTVFRELQPGGLGIGLVAAADLHGRSENGNGRFAGVFAYVPATVSFGDDRFLLHGNLGWRYEPDGDEDDGESNGDNGTHSLLWAARGDLRLPWLDERFVVVGDLFSENGNRPEYQVGLRFRAVPDRFILDLSWGGHTAQGAEGRGWVFGFGWTPPPF
jgi:hypothetical protein